MHGRKLVFRQLAVLLLLFCCGLLHARNQIVEQATLEDPGGQLTYSQVREMPFASAPKVIGHGYTQSTLWLRLTVDAGDDARSLVLRVFPAILDKVLVYSPGNVLSGQALVGNTLLLEGKPGRREYYLQITTGGSMLVLPVIDTIEQSHQEDVRRGIVLGAVAACSIALIAAILVLIGLRRDPMYFLFLINFTVSIAVFFGWFGYLEQFFGDDSLVGSPVTFSFLVVLNIFTGVYFFWTVLSHFGLPRWGHAIFVGFSLLYIPAFVLLFFIERQLVMSYCTLLGLVVNAVMLPVTVLLFYRKKLVGWYIGSLIVLAIGLLIRTFLIMRGSIAPDASMINVMAFRLFAFSGFFFTVLLVLAKNKTTLLQTALLNEAVARSRADAETQRREVQQRFMTMLMHELKTPLAIIQMAASSLGRHLAPDTGDAKRVRNINRSVDDLNALVERCVQAEQIEEGVLVVKHQLFSANVLAQELVGTLEFRRIFLNSKEQFNVCSDQQYLRLILQNLLSNALKYSPRDSMVELALHATQDGSIKFAVSNAVGMAGEPDPERIFTRYYRSEAARGEVGAGLGLWLAQEMARQIGSRVSFSMTGGRVMFSFGLASA
jgi:signal transduction histidine kinase